MSAQWRSKLQGAEGDAFRLQAMRLHGFCGKASGWLTDGGECTAATENVAQPAGADSETHGMILIAAMCWWRHEQLARGWLVAGRGG